MTARPLDLLVALGICDPGEVEPFHSRVRDRDDISVLRCRRSGVIFLSRSDHATESWYAERRDLCDWSPGSHADALRSCRDDDERYARLYGPLIRGRQWLDVGAGAGGVLELLASSATRACAVEPQQGAREALLAAGHEAYASLGDIPDAQFDVVTLFHVLEHMPDPVGVLREIAARLSTDGRVIIEVPHARDLLLWLECDAFKRFTLWSEHLILHTRVSLDAVCRAAGLAAIEITGVQRYPVANHLHWLATGRPGGHRVWAHLVDDELSRAYAATLTRVDRTDTLAAICGKPAPAP